MAEVELSHPCFIMISTTSLSHLHKSVPHLYSPKCAPSTWKSIWTTKFQLSCSLWTKDSSVLLFSTQPVSFLFSLWTMALALTITVKFLPWPKINSILCMCNRKIKGFWLCLGCLFLTLSYWWTGCWTRAGVDHLPKVWATLLIPLWDTCYGLLITSWCYSVYVYW